jgi:hypothetical protein
MVRPMTMVYPQKGPMILQRTSPPWLENPVRGVRQGRLHAERRPLAIYPFWHRAARHGSAGPSREGLSSGLAHVTRLDLA